jgi:hypothetical protein
MPPSLRKPNPPSLQIVNLRKNQAHVADVDADAAVAAVPEPRGNVAVQSESKKPLRTLPSPPPPVTESQHPAAVHRGPEMPWWNPSGSIGKMNWSQRRKR